MFLLTDRSIQCRYALVILTTLLLSGCASSGFDPQTATAVSVQTELGAPTIADTLPILASATIVGPGDRMEFRVFGIGDLDRTVRVDSSGTINLPLIGSVMVAGRELNTVRSEVESRLRERYLRDPSVSLEVVETVSQRFMVDGGVREPGLYPVVGNQTLMQAVAQARGTTETAQLNEVIVFRTINGVQSAARFNLDDIRGGRSGDPLIFANDRIIVGNDNSRLLLRDLLSLTPLLGVFYQVFR